MKPGTGAERDSPTYLQHVPHQKGINFTVLTMAFVLAMAATALNADSTKDPVTGLALPDGLTPSKDADQMTMCGKPGQANQYFRRSETVAAEIAWFKDRLPGFHLYHAFWTDRSQDTFFSPDGTKGINITGTPKSDKVFSITYLQFKTGMTEHVRQTFSPSNPQCK